MKKVIIAIIIIINSVCLYGQNHMKFMGMELTGNKYDFILDFVDNPNVKCGNTGLYLESFAGYKNCKIEIESSVTSNTVYGMRVYVKNGEDLIQSYVKKYGDFVYEYEHYKWEFEEGCIFILTDDTDLTIVYEDKIGSRLDTCEREIIWSEKESVVFKDI